MKRGKYAEYGFRFRDGKKEFYINKGIRLGAFSFWKESVTLSLDQVERIAELIQEAKVIDAKPEEKP